MMHYLPAIWFGAMLSLVVFDIVQPPGVVIVGVLSAFIGLMIYCDDGVMQREQSHDTHH